MSDNPDDRAAIEAMAKDAAQSDEWQWHLLQDEQQQAYLRRSTAALAALRDAGWWVERWRPIGEAPKDGLIDIIIDGKTMWTNCYYDQICDQWRTIGPSGHLAWVPARAVTHWRERPPPPPPEPRDV